MVLPYLVLVAVSVACFAAAWRIGDRRLIAAFYVVTGSTIGLGDVGMHGFGGLYRYRPHLLSKPLADDMLGMILAEFFFVPVMTSLLALLPPHRRWMGAIGAGALVTVIEQVFTRMGVFQRTGWPVGATAVAFAVFYGLFVPWTVYFERRGCTPLNRAIIITSGITYLQVLMIKYTALTAGLWGVAPGWLRGTFPDKVLGILLFMWLPMLLVAHAGTWLAWTQFRWYFLAAAAGFALWTFGLDLAGIWQQGSFWNPILQGLVLGAQLLAVHLLDNWLAGERIRV